MPKVKNARFVEQLLSSVYSLYSIFPSFEQKGATDDRVNRIALVGRSIHAMYLMTLYFGCLLSALG